MNKPKHLSTRTLLCAPLTLFKSTYSDLAFKSSALKIDFLCQCIVPVDTVTDMSTRYRRIPIITAPVIFGFSSPKGPLLSGGRYFRVAVTFGWLENVCNSAVVLHKEDT